MLGAIKSSLVFFLQSVFGQKEEPAPVRIREPPQPVVSSYNLRERTPVNYKEDDEEISEEQN
jgi:hypothetical protein